ncbi:MAG: Adaptive-response sensory-kinase SasA [Gemmatimonadaceae bacterium]|nr:Adaptive-response sensory-kinase SasA [Gemmatimonadaceae bacterium]
MSRISAATSVTRVTVLVVLLCVTVLVASLLAYEAHDASRSERVTIERALHDYASVAAWELQSAARKRVDNALQRSLSPATTGWASSPYETLLPLSAVSSPGAGLLPCAAGVPDSTRTYLRLDLRDGSYVTSGYAMAVGDRLPAIVAMRAFAQTRATPEQPYGLVRLRRSDGTFEALALGVKYATHGAPLAAFGFTVCREALGAPLVRTVLASHALLPAAVRGALPNDSLVAVRLTDSGGRELLRTGAVAGPYSATVTIDSALGVQATVAVQPAAATRLVVGEPARSSVPLLLALLVLTAGLAAVALFQLRREHELARVRADFTSSVSHELRTPLAQILLFGETLSLGRTRGDAERALAARTIVSEARRLMGIVDNILSFERARRIPMTPRLEAVDVVQLTEDVVQGFKPLADVRGARIGVTVMPAAREGACGVAHTDASMLRQILVNLLDNAIKYGPDGQSVAVVVSVAGDELRMTVEDEGPGISVRDRDRVWEPYVRLRASAGTRSRSAGIGGGNVGGSGLGLAVVRDLAGSLGARVWVEDVDGKASGRHVGRGARFGVALPLAAGGGPPPHIHSVANASFLPHPASAHGIESLPASNGVPTR